MIGKMDDLKKRIEVEVAQRFLDLYNEGFRSAYEIIESGESPDVYCRDRVSEKELNLEITILENLEGDAQKEFERIRGERLNLGTSLGMRGNLENILQNIQISLDKKLLASYSGTSTALVIARIITIWSCNELRQFIGGCLRELLKGKEDNFPMGIWIFCTDEQRTGEDILNLLEI